MLALISEAIPISANGIHDGIGDFLPEVTGVEARFADRIGDERGFEQDRRHSRPGQHIEPGPFDSGIRDITIARGERGDRRTLQQLRKDGLIELKDRRLRILDLAGLRALGEFEDDYLYFEKRAR